MYPHNNGADGELFYQLIVQFRDRHFAEKLICSCDFDFSLAQTLGTFCHGNIYLLKKLCALFSNDLPKALRFINCFLSSLSSDSSLSPFFLTSQFLSRFNNDVSSATPFLSKFFESAQSEQAKGSRFSDESSFKLALSGCNGDISAAEAFSRLSGIKHLELLYDSELHPRNVQEFHSRCDEQGPTVTFVCANGNCVCGVIESSWISPTDDQFQYVFDPSANLLRLSPDPRKFPINVDQAQYALFCHAACGPCFGYGIDLAIHFASEEKYPKGLVGWVKQNWSYILPVNGFLFPTTNGTDYPIDRIVVCSFKTNKK